MEQIEALAPCLLYSQAILRVYPTQRLKTRLNLSRELKD